MKRVRYNGGTTSFYRCSDPASLIVGKEYEVLAKRRKQWQIDYVLKGVKGYFCSSWFSSSQSKKGE